MRVRVPPPALYASHIIAGVYIPVYTYYPPLATSFPLKIPLEKSSKWLIFLDFMGETLYHACKFFPFQKEMSRWVRQHPTRLVRPQRDRARYSQDTRIVRHPRCRKQEAHDAGST